MNQSVIAWLCLLGAAISETVWTYSLKYLDVAGLRTLRWSTFYRMDGGLPILIPWIAYAVFGVVISVLLAVAMRTIPTALAFAVWMAGSLIFIKLADVIWLKAGWSYAEVFFGAVIIAGIIGFKLAGPTP